MCPTYDAHTSIVCLVVVVSVVGTLPGWEEQGDISDGVSKVTLTNGGVIQQLCNVGVDANAAGAGHSPALAYELPNASVCTFHSTLGTSMYQSASRGRARTVCGWFHLLVNVQQPYDKLNDSTSADVDAVDTDETVKGVKAGKNSYLGSNITSSLLNGGDSDESDESELDEVCVDMSCSASYVVKVCISCGDVMRSVYRMKKNRLLLYYLSSYKLTY